MEEDYGEIASPVVKTTRRDSGLFAYFDIKSNLQRRDSGLNINDFDKEAVSLNKSDDDDDSNYFRFPVVNEIIRESGSPIQKNKTFSFDNVPPQKFSDKENCSNDISSLESEHLVGLSSTASDKTCDHNSPGDQNGCHSVNSRTAMLTPEDKQEDDSKSENRVLSQKNLNVKDKNSKNVTEKPPLPNSCPPNSAISRVDLILKSDLFKKYLSKHENLIDKISLRQGRGNGLKKAFSNLDISQLDFCDDVNTEDNSLSSSCSFNEESSQNEWEKTPIVRHRRNTFSETDFKSESSSGEQQNASQPINLITFRPSRRSRQKFAIPSFQEFKNSKLFKQIPEEGTYDNDDQEESCEHCDKNRALENEKKKSRSHARCQRIKEKYLQNHGENVTLKLNKNNEDQRDANISETKSDSDLQSLKIEQKSLRKSEIPIRINTTIQRPSHRKLPEIPTSEPISNTGNSLSRNENKSANIGLPPKPDSRVILRASRKRKKTQKKPFSRSQSDSQIETNNISSTNLSENKKCKPPPLDIKTFSNFDRFSDVSSSPLYSASTVNDTHSPLSSTTGMFDFSPDVVSNFEQNVTNVDGNLTTEFSRNDSEEKNVGLNVHEPDSEITEKENPSAIANVELWSDDTDKQIETLSTNSECSNRLAEEPDTCSSSQKQCIFNESEPLEFQQHFDLALDPLSLDSKSSVTRSTSDVCNSTTLDALKKRRERKERPYKSDPFTGSLHLPEAKPKSLTPSKDDVFDIDEISLEEVEEEDEKVSLLSDEDWKTQHRLSDISLDSGVIGPDGPSSPTSTVFSTSSSIWSDLTSTGTNDEKVGGSCTSPRFKVLNGCKDCGNIDGVGKTRSCPKCEKRSVERKEIIMEIKETEASYGRDLFILKEHFYKPMKSTGLLSLEQLEGIFLNLDELIHVNLQFVKKLQSAVDVAIKRGDENLKTVSIGNLFLDSSSLMLAFENYCVNQGQATALMEQLEKEKELLRIFLKVSQDENQILRRMPMNSFLMVPVQRIMRYPLLLERLYKFTSGDHCDKSALMEAKLKIEDILDHINSKTKHGGTIKLKRKISESIFQRISITEKIEVNKVAIEVLGWNRKEVCDISICRLQVAPLSDQTWATKRLKTLKLTTVHCVLLTLGQNDTEITEIPENDLLFARKSNVIQAAVVLIKEKNGKYQTFREPFMLNRCIVSVDPETDDSFELSDSNKEPFMFKGEDSKELQSFLQAVKQQTLNLGIWRRRRNALPNIMIKHMI